MTRNEGSGPSNYARVDLRWSRDWKLTGTGKEKAPTATLMADAFNVFNHANYVTYIGALSSPFFGAAVAAQPSRRLQLGARLSFSLLGHRFLRILQQSEQFQIGCNKNTSFAAIIEHNGTEEMAVQGTQHVRSPHGS